MKTIEVFDPAMCCSTGVCGPSVDPELIRMANAVYFLEEKDSVSVQRYNLANEPNAFVTNETVKQLLDESGSDVLPVTMVDGQLAKKRDYPTNQELSTWTGINEDQLTVQSSPNQLDITFQSES